MKDVLLNPFSFPTDRLVGPLRTWQRKGAANRQLLVYFRQHCSLDEVSKKDINGNHQGTKDLSHCLKPNKCTITRRQPWPTWKATFVLKVFKFFADLNYRAYRRATAFPHRSDGTLLDSQMSFSPPPSSCCTSSTLSPTPGSSGTSRCLWTMGSFNFLADGFGTAAAAATAATGRPFFCFNRLVEKLSFGAESFFFFGGRFFFLTSQFCNKKWFELMNESKVYFSRHDLEANDEAQALWLKIKNGQNTNFCFAKSILAKFGSEISQHAKFC